MTKKKNTNCKGPWFAMPYNITLSNEIFGSEFKILTVLLQQENQFYPRDPFYCTEAWISSTTGLSVLTVKKSIKWLAEKRFITITKSGRANYYSLNWDYINAYKAPNAPKEEIVEDTSNQPESVVETAQTAPTLDLPDNEIDMTDSIPEPEPVLIPEPQPVYETAVASCPRDWEAIVDKNDLLNLYHSASIGNNLSMVFYLSRVVNQVWGKFPGVSQKEIQNEWLSPAYNRWLASQPRSRYYPPAEG